MADSLTYTIGAVVEEQTLTNSIGERLPPLDSIMVSANHRR